ncbi:MAG: DUF1579 domain-containing protein [Planctomycetota bacterium]
MKRFPTKTLALTACLLLPAAAGAQDFLPKPTAEHQIIARDAGVWNAEGKFYMSPGAKPIESKCVETNTMLGPMWLISEFKGNFAGLPFKGHAQLGYDPASKKFIGTWVDTMSPYMGSMEGAYDAETSTLTMVGATRSAQTGEVEHSTNVTQWKADGTKVFTMYAGKPGEDGKPAADAWKMMEVTYTRAE